MNRVFEMLTDDGKDKLHVLMEKCEPHLGVFFVLAEVASGISSFSFRPWFKKQGTCNTAIWVGDALPISSSSRCGRNERFMNQSAIRLAILSKTVRRRL